MEDKVGLTLACLNIKKLVKMMVGKTCYFIQIPQYYWIMGELSVKIKKTNIKNDVCPHSERLATKAFYSTYFSTLLQVVISLQPMLIVPTNTIDRKGGT